MDFERELVGSSVMASVLFLLAWFYGPLGGLVLWVIGVKLVARSI